MSHYTQRYAGGFADGNGAKPVDAQFLNAVEAALLQLLGADPVDGQLGVYDSVLARFKPTLIKNAHIDPAAAIDKSKLAALNIGNADIAAAAAIALSKLAGYPSDGSKAPRGDGSWAVTPQAPYRKTTIKPVSNTIAETDLLNGEITVGAGAMGATGMLRLTAAGDFFNFSGAPVAAPRFKLKLGSTTLFDTSTIAAVCNNSTGHWGWKIVAEIMNTGAANSQQGSFSLLHSGRWTSGSTVDFATGEGTYSTLNNMAIAEGLNSVNVDTTLAQLLQLTVTLPVANANVNAVLGYATVEIV